MSISYCELCAEARTCAPQSTESSDPSPTASADHLSSSLRHQMSTAASTYDIALPQLYTYLTEYSDLTGEAPNACLNTLEECKWDFNSAKNAYLQGLSSPVNRKGYEENRVVVTCPICFCEAEEGEALVLTACGHTFCKECIQEQTKARMEEGDVEIQCLSHGCAESLSHAEVRQASGDAVFETLSKRGLDRATALEPSLHNCRTPDCTYVVSFDPLNDAVPPSLSCPLCKTTCCLSCGAAPYHTSMTCVEHKKTLDNEEDERAMAAFMKESGIRECMQCGMAVMKESGCDKMKCRCGYKFCYICGIKDAKCSCTGTNHGFWDNITHRGDFT